MKRNFFPEIWRGIRSTRIKSEIVLCPSSGECQEICDILFDAMGHRLSSILPIGPRFRARMNLPSPFGDYARSVQPVERPSLLPPLEVSLRTKVLQKLTH